MANQTDDDGQANIARIKHDVLIHWALQPPQLQMLRPIDALVTSIHKVFPPALGVPAHAYFQKWTALGPSDVANAAKVLDEERLKNTTTAHREEGAATSQPRRASCIAVYCPSYHSIKKLAARDSLELEGFIVIKTLSKYSFPAETDRLTSPKEVQCGTPINLSVGLPTTLKA